jgi:hypothetical protein
LLPNVSFKLLYYRRSIFFCHTERRKTQGEKREVAFMTVLLMHGESLCNVYVGVGGGGDISADEFDSPTLK